MLLYSVQVLLFEWLGLFESGLPGALILLWHLQHQNLAAFGTIENTNWQKFWHLREHREVHLRFDFC